MHATTKAKRSKRVPAAPPPPDLAPIPAAANRSKPPAAPLGILCPNCGRPVCGRVPEAVRQRVKAARGETYRPKFVAYVRYRAGAINRVRACPHCDRRFLTAERIISNATGR